MAKIRIKQIGKKEIESIITPFTNYMKFYDREIKEGKFKDYFQSIIEDERVFIYTANLDNRVAGLMVIYQTFSSFECGKILFLNDLWVEPEFRKLGVGHALMTEIKEIAKEKNCKRVDLQTDLINVKARALYEKNGMIADKEFINYSVKI
jgi:ribosomal protein S18 acetylase RimI-like enzyme